jgi:glycosyltransferase involved in cell wall biosynthesis
VNIVIVCSNSTGLVVDSKVVEQALRHRARSMGADLTIQNVRLPWQLYYRRDPVRYDRLKIGGKPDAIVFLENIFESDPPFDGDILKILIPNPEWLTPRTEGLLKAGDQIWHKSRFSHDQLKHRVDNIDHYYIGFTSIDPNKCVTNYDTFAHFRGKSLSRNSAEILSLWKKNPRLPTLNYQFYQDGLDSFEFSEWLTWGNVRVRADKMDEASYFEELSSCGLHLCTSSVEGFGHYINEARAMSAVPIVIDAPPMNELVDEDSGILMPSASNSPKAFGIQYKITALDLEDCIDRVISLDHKERERLGRNARARFLSERAQFVERIGARFEDILKLKQ